LLRRCQQRAVELFTEELGPHRVTPRQFALLVTVYQRPGLTQTDLVGATGIDRSTVGDMLDRLVRRGLIKRKRSGKDQRANTLHILPPGIETLRSAITFVDRVQARILDPVPSDLRATLVAALKLMAGLADRGQSPRQEE
jgi:DNA-binding MarR family transcriptional regulator